VLKAVTCPLGRASSSVGAFARTFCAFVGYAAKSDTDAYNKISDHRVHCPLSGFIASM